MSTLKENIATLICEGIVDADVAPAACEDLYMLPTDRIQDVSKAIAMRIVGHLFDTDERKRP